MTSYVFDGVTILNADASTAVTVNRPTGPLEVGYVNGSSVWIPDTQPTLIGAGFGIDSSGNAYFDAAGATVGEGASFYVDPTTDEMWLER